MKKVAFLFLLLFLLIGCSSDLEKGKISNITCEEKEKLMKDGAVLIDVRSNSEFELSHLDGAISIEYGAIESKISSFVSSKEIKIIVYCQSGARSRIAAQTLIDLGYQNVYDLGGIENCGK